MVGRRQPRYVSEVLSYVRRKRHKLHLGTVFYYNWIDTPPLDPSQDFWGDHMGMYRANLVPKRVARVISKAAARLNG